MAEKKYEMLIEPRRIDSSFRIRPQPWYKERLSSKYESKPSLNASSWTFIKDGLDDFRDGNVPVVDSSVIIKGSKGVKPSIFGSDSFEGMRPKQRMKKRLTKEEAVYTKSMPNQQKRQQKIAEVEKNLMGHPLALYSHVPPELFEDIVDLLDPSMTLSNDVIDEEPKSREDLFNVISEDVTSDEEIKTDTEYFKALKNSRKKQAQTTANNDDVCKDDKSRMSRKNKTSQQMTEIESVTKEFCDWVRDLGGETNDMEESTINNLFASGYDAKPTLSVPVHVVELTNVPAELRADCIPKSTSEPREKKFQETQPYTPSWVKVKYGAWYLNPKTWAARPSNEPLKNPKDFEEKEMSESKKKSKDLDKTIRHLHGAKAFKEFADKKGGRSPEIQENQPTKDLVRFTLVAKSTSLLNKSKSFRKFLEGVTVTEDELVVSGTNNRDEKLKHRLSK